MDKFLTFPGIQPVYLNDIDFMQESVREAFRLLLQGLTGLETPNCILLAPTESRDGVICFEGEILPYKFYSGVISRNLCLRIESSYSGSRTFKDGATRDCYESRYVVGYDGDSLTEPHPIRGFFLFSELIRQPQSVAVNHMSDRKENDNVIVEIHTASIGDLYHVEGQISILNEGNYEVVISDMVVAMSASMVAASPKYFMMIINIGGVMQAVPAKMTIAYNTTNSCKISISINRTHLTTETDASFSFTLTA